MDRYDIEDRVYHIRRVGSYATSSKDHADQIVAKAVELGFTNFSSRKSGFDWLVEEREI